jgi:GTP:adenosylcobinamide-phosphate guanylyltransferase
VTMEIIAASGSGYERDLQVLLDGVVIYCTTTIVNKYMDKPCIDNDLLNATIKENSFSLAYSVLCRDSKVLFDQPFPRSPSSVLNGICIAIKEEDSFVIRNSVLGAVFVSFENAVELSLGQTVFVRGELHVDSAFINLGGVAG